jgi:hypothetical protein
MYENKEKFGIDPRKAVIRLLGIDEAHRPKETTSKGLILTDRRNRWICQEEVC